MTYAVVKTGGKQYKAALGEVITVEKIEQEVGSTFELPVLFSEGGKVVKAFAEIIEHGKGDKVIIFKKKRRHHYRRKNGHRQPLTSIQIIQIGDAKIESGQKKVAKAPKNAPEAKIKAPKTEQGTAAKPAKAAKTEAKAETKKPAAKKAPAAKKTTKKESE
jgi:large subunit ribosomal protein L21